MPLDVLSELFAAGCIGSSGVAALVLRPVQLYLVYILAAVVCVLLFSR